MLPPVLKVNGVEMGPEAIEPRDSDAIALQRQALDKAVRLLGHQDES